MNYLAQSRSEEDKTSYLQPFEESLATAEGEKPLEENVDRRRKIAMDFGVIRCEAERNARTRPWCECAEEMKDRVSVFSRR